MTTILLDIAQSPDHRELTITLPGKKITVTAQCPGRDERHGETAAWLFWEVEEVS